MRFEGRPHFVEKPQVLRLSQHECAGHTVISTTYDSEIHLHSLKLGMLGIGVIPAAEPAAPAASSGPEASSGPGGHLGRPFYYQHYHDYYHYPYVTITVSITSITITITSLVHYPGGHLGRPGRPVGSRY